MAFGHGQHKAGKRLLEALAVWNDDIRCQLYLSMCKLVWRYTNGLNAICRN
jgi:hypothetical protein